LQQQAQAAELQRQQAEADRRQRGS
jgi:hypothetical protein